MKIYYSTTPLLYTYNSQADDRAVPVFNPFFLALNFWPQREISVLH